MAKLSSANIQHFVKAIYCGVSGSGKTGSLISLLQAGYKLRILDMDGNISPLVALCEHINPSLLENIDIISPADVFRSSQSAGFEVKGQPKAYVSMLSALNKWDDDSIPAEWGNESILVVDTLTAVGKAAYHWARGMDVTAKDKRQWFFAAQQSIITMLEFLASSSFKTNVLILTHIDFIEDESGVTQAFPSAIGKAIGPKVAMNFPTLILAATKQRGGNVERSIYTVPTNMVDVKNPKPFALPPKLPLETGLATIFEELKKTPMQGDKA